VPKPLALLLGLVALPPNVAAEPAASAEPWRAARPAVVRIAQGAGIGAGFLFHSDRHVATAYHVIQTGRPIVVRLLDGQELSARVVAFSGEDDLAILELEKGLAGVAPLTLATGSAPSLGAKVTVLGHPYAPQAEIDSRLAGLLDWSVTTGIVSGVNARYVQTDAPINQGNSGGPLLDEQGRVIGVVVMQIGGADGLGFAVSAPRLAALETTLDPDLDFRGEWVPGLGLGWRTDVGAGAEVTGFVLGMRTVAWDRLAFELRVGSLTNTLIGDDRYPQTRAGRLTTALTAGWRFLFVLPGNVPLYLVPILGASVDRESEARLEQLLAYAEPGCQPGPSTPCPVTSRVRQVETRDEVAVRPIVGLALELGPMLVGYEVRPGDLSDPGDLIHQIAIGFWL